MAQPFVSGLPGIRATVTATPRIVFKQLSEADLAGGGIISGAASRDPGNTGDLGVLRAGLLMGKITASGKFAPALLGTIAAYTSGGTELTVSAAVATEIERLVGQSGTAELVAIGPPSANGTLAVTSVDHSAINTTTGVITVTSLGVNKVAGTFLAVNDGRHVPLTVLPDGFGVNVLSSADNTTSQDQYFSMLPIGGVLISENLLPSWPTDTSIQAWINSSLNTYGKFVLDHGYLA
jgi:hypothetical protein